MQPKHIDGISRLYGKRVLQAFARQTSGRDQRGTTFIVDPPGPWIDFLRLTDTRPDRVIAVRIATVEEKSHD
jgi:hypothetical protein